MIRQIHLQETWSRPNFDMNLERGRDAAVALWWKKSIVNGRLVWGIPVV